MARVASREARYIRIIVMSALLTASTTLPVAPRPRFP